MIFYKAAPEALAGYHLAISAAITDAFKVLLEQKHLYQYVAIDDDQIKQQFRPFVENNAFAHLEKHEGFVRKASQYHWILRNDVGLASIKDNRPIGLAIPFFMPDATLYCQHCERHEAFNVVTAGSVVQADDYATPVSRDFKTKIEQVYSVSFLCQRCKKFPEVILIRRSAGRLTLCGRAPMEHVEVPAFVPKAISRFYSGALMGFQSNQVLAANFMLRTAIEQWAISFVEEGLLGGAAVEAYTSALPDDFKQHFPSLHDLYQKLSEDIHAAKGSSELFEAMSGKFLEHFDARRVRKLPGPNQ